MIRIVLRNINAIYFFQMDMTSTSIMEETTLENFMYTEVDDQTRKPTTDVEPEVPP